ncbi:MAG: hypothetical protein DRI99_02450 [Candidatus Aminicenantes bacterium]|nr:MAG: hypothetical protein B5M54_07840 [Candidatus Aminicenantes bacterium 4484_214]RLE03439.1 MAG: hypothetical protein DRJ11_04210 [Candidatus Aminicenantes bacterium]RLE05266.1 MAG: hypothetical protein DRI99_02450 [Candidatus Aminicenantes bacterium]HHF43412.1 polymer-forming cytoskeletal protein [Candidatus Aminicenantes bacterium]
MSELKKTEFQSPPISSHLSLMARETFIEGKIKANNDLIIHGQYKGSLRLPGNTLIIEKTARVEASVEVRAIILRGYFKGNILAHEKVLIESGAFLEGEIETPCLAIEEKAQFKGRIKMKKEKLPR